MRAIAALAGIALVGAHLAGFHYLAQRSRGHELAIAAPPLVVDRGDAPGLVHRTWSESFRGGHTRTVSATQLVGPFQDPATPACTGRLVVGQEMLDQIANEMADQISLELTGMNVFPVGDFEQVRQVSLRWAKDHALVRATIGFARVDVPITVRLYPERKGASLSFRMVANAQLDFGNRLIQWVSNKVHADAIATRIAREQLDDVLVTTFAPPPPFALPGGQTLQFVYCDGPIEIVEGAYGALPFAVAIGGPTGEMHVLPPRFATGSRAPVAPRTTLALDLDVDALNALLFELWRTGWLDARLADVGLDRRFNSDPIVTEYLSIRVSPLRLALPPVIAPGPGGRFQLAADARVTIADGTRSTVGRVYGALDFAITAAAPDVSLGALDVSCERDAATLVPCYGDLVSALRDRGSEFHGALTDAFTKLLEDIFVKRRLVAPGFTADVVIDKAEPSIGTGGTLHLQLWAELTRRMPD